MIVTFQQIAADAVSRGFAVIPLQPGSKDPDMALVPRINNQPGTGGATRRTRSLDTIAQWALVSPNANVGVCSDDTVTILETDNEVQFRQLVRDVSRQLFGESRELPDTLTSQARQNRPHFFFLATDVTRAVDGAPGIQGLFEWRRENQYVVGPGSLHPTGVIYRIIRDVPMVPMPAWLVEVLQEVRHAYRGQQSRASNYVQVGPAAIARDKLLNEYALDPWLMIADDGFELHVPAGERHYFLQAMAGLLHDGERDEDALIDILKALRDKYCESGKGDYEIQNLASWTVRQKPSQVEPNLPIYCKGGVIFKSKEAMDAAPAPTKTADDFTWRYPAVPGKTREYVLEPLKKFDGWFPRGRPSLIAGSSGSGKSTFMLDMLHRQRKGEYVLSHRGAGLRYLVLFADRGHLANLETLERLGLENAGLPVDYLSPVWGIFAVEAIKNAIENYEANELPQTVFVEGGDMLVEDPNKAPLVAEFMVGLQRLAAHYHIALILSVGAPKISKQNAPTARRDMVFGSQMWSRNADTICVLTTDGDGTSGQRKLTAQHRNEATEEYSLEFKNGLLIESKPVGEANDVIAQWLLSEELPYTLSEAVAGLKQAEADASRSTVFRRVKALVAAGQLTEVFGADKKVRYQKKEKA